MYDMVGKIGLCVPEFSTLYRLSLTIAICQCEDALLVGITDMYRLQVAVYRAIVIV